LKERKQMTLQDAIVVFLYLERLLQDRVMLDAAAITQLQHAREVIFDHGRLLVERKRKEMNAEPMAGQRE
jgi:hypothetical protein